MDERYFDKHAMEVRVDESDIIVGMTLIVQDLPDEEPVRIEASGTFISKGDLIELVRVKD